MTIKAIRELNTLEPELKAKVLQRFESLPNFSEMVRYTAVSWSPREAGHPYFLAKI